MNSILPGRESERWQALLISNENNDLEFAEIVRGKTAKKILSAAGYMGAIVLVLSFVENDEKNISIC